MSPPLILLVDDAPDIGFLIEHYGVRAGQNVVHCVDAVAAWEFLQHTRPDLTILDVHLPGESGLDLCRRIRATAPLAGLGVALFCDWGCADNIVAGLDAGADFLLSKDLLGQPEAWQARIQDALQMLEDRRVADPVSGTATHPSAPPPEGWIIALNQTLRHPVLRQLGPHVIQAINRRALQRAMTACGCAAVAPLNRTPPDATDWLLPAGQGLNPERLAQSGSRELVAAFAASLPVQLRALLGTKASAPFRAALQAALAALACFQPRE